MGMEEITGRVAVDLEHLKQFTATPGNGCTRLPFTKEARDAVDFLKKLMAEAGLEVSEDAAGNVIGVLKGENPEAPCVMMGSHYDSVVNGGDFDGIAGGVCALEVARQLQENGKPLKRNFVAVGFCDEEGMRFGTGYFGSGAMLGHRDTAYCKNFKDTDGVSIYDAMKSYGLDPETVTDAAWTEGSIGHFLEAHIEQGPVLDAEDIEIGLVDCIVGIQRYMVTVHGRADHAGTTPMNMRMDAVDAATKIISKIADWAREKADGTVAAVGYINTIPGGMNIVAERWNLQLISVPRTMIISMILQTASAQRWIMKRRKWAAAMKLTPSWLSHQSICRQKCWRSWKKAARHISLPINICRAVQDMIRLRLVRSFLRLWFSSQVRTAEAIVR